MRIYGLDFTSTPSRRKPLIALGCTLSDGVLRVEGAEEMTGFAGFEAFLGRPGPWVCGMDFPNVRFYQRPALRRHRRADAAVV